MWLSVDGSATIDVNASLEALAALRGANLDLDPDARPDRDAVRALFTAPGFDVGRPTFFRRGGRRFVHVRVQGADVRRMSQVAPLAWSAYRFERAGEAFEFRQVVGKPAGAASRGIEWRGDEVVAFRMHVPSEVLFENATSDVQRGNILTWEQSLGDRLRGVPVELHVRMQPESILYSTLLLFGSTILGAAAVFIGVIWWLRRRGARALRMDARAI